MMKAFIRSPSTVKYITLLNISINAFDEWEEEIYPNEVPFYSSRLLSLALLAFDKSYMNLAGGIENPFFNIDEAYEYANKAVEMLNSPKLQKKYAGIFLQRADHGFTRYMLSEDKNIAVLCFLSSLKTLPIIIASPISSI